MTVQSSTPVKREPSGTEGSVKETIESILIAFILAFIFRAFVVEAFVIPTGSMGPTLMGAHMRITCPDCGYQFAVNYSNGKNNDEDTDIEPMVARTQPLICPNCGFSIPPSRVGRAASDGRAAYDPTDFSPVYFGDRILVLKYRYLFELPKRWDVVVFKSPYESVRDPNDPKYAANYIKRLVGEPGETIMVLDGDVYTAPRGTKPAQFTIQRKPPHAQQALWRDVFDNDYLPQGKSRGLSPPWVEPWKVRAGSGWHGPAGGGDPARIFHFDNAADASTIAFDSEVNHPFDSLTDWLAYDQRGSLQNNGYVSDLKLSCVYRRASGQGPLRLQLTKRHDCFTAEFLPGKVILRRDALLGTDPVKLGDPLWSKPIEAAIPELDSSGRPVEIEFSNVDYQVSIRVNGRIVIDTTDAQYKPDVAALYKEARQAHQEGSLSNSGKPVVLITAERQQCSLEHLRLARDVYYLNMGHHLQPTGDQSSEPYYASPESPQELGADEYFVMGDNALVSLDARWWGAPVNLPREGNYQVGAGRVPGRFMLGKAFFVYWPAGYRPLSIPFGIEPDFGDMRFIH